MACSQPNLNPSYFNSLRGYGKDFLPIWVGYQSACYSGFSGDSISTNLSTAYQQGEQEASNAIATDSSLTIAQTGYIAADLEGYEQGAYVGTYGLSNCEYEALYFVSGYDNTIEADGYNPVIYGSSGGSDLSLYASADPVPSEIFFAESYGGSNTGVSSYIPASAWSHNQRIKQYAIDVANSYVPTRSLDEDCADATLLGQ